MVVDKKERPRGITLWMDYFIQTFLPSITQQESDMIRDILYWEDEKKAAFLMAKQLFEEKEDQMDKKIKEIQKDTKKLEKKEDGLLKADKKRDKVCDYGEKMMKKKQLG